MVTKPQNLNFDKTQKPCKNMFLTNFKKIVSLPKIDALTTDEMFSGQPYQAMSSRIEQCPAVLGNFQPFTAKYQPFTAV